MFGAILGTASLAVGVPQFLAILLLAFGLFMILAGIFTAYFGSGKSRTIGVGLLVAGFVIFLLTGYWYHITPGYGGLTDLIEESILVLVAAVIGALAAIAIFLVAIMKS
jgi:hypothetical protein